MTTQYHTTPGCSSLEMCRFVMHRLPQRIFHQIIVFIITNERWKHKTGDEKSGFPRLAPKTERRVRAWEIKSDFNKKI